MKLLRSCTKPLVLYSAVWSEQISKSYAQGHSNAAHGHSSNVISKKKESQDNKYYQLWHNFISSGEINALCYIGKNATAHPKKD